MAQSIDLKVNAGGAAAALAGVEQAADKAEQALSGVAEAVVSVNDLAGNATGGLEGLATLLNDFLQRRAAASGQTPKLFDAGADIEALKAIRAEFAGLVKDTKNLPNGLGSRMTLTGQAGVQTPERVRFEKFDANAANQQRARDAMVLNLLRRVMQNKPLDLGLTEAALNGRQSLPVVPGAPGASDVPAPRKPDDDSRGMLRAGRQLLGNATAGSGVAGQAVNAAVTGGTHGALGALPGGMLGGAAIGIAGFALLKGAEAISEAVHRSKSEAGEVDRFKRSIGDVAVRFDELRERLRGVGEGFSLTFEQSRRLALEFAKIAQVRDGADPRGALGQAREGIALSQAVGIDESDGVRLIAGLRHDKNLGETQQQARLFGIQVAEALKRSGSTLNAPELMQALASYSHETTSRSLGATNVQGYSALLSAMAGSGVPGLDVHGAASLIGKADAAYTGGGRMGEASQTLQYLALGGDRLGPLLTYARQEAGLFGSEKSTFGGPHNPLAQYLHDSGGRDLSGLNGTATGLQSVMGMFDANIQDPEMRLLALRNHFGLGVNQAAALYNLRSEGKLDATTGLVDQYNAQRPAGQRIDLSRVSGTGYTALAELAVNRRDLPGLEAFRDNLAGRKDLDDTQRQQLVGLRGEKNEDKLRAGLVQIAATLEREKNSGQEIQDSSARTANATQRLADQLVPATLASRNFLAALVEKLAPDTDAGRDLARTKKLEQIAQQQGDADAGRPLAPAAAARATRQPGLGLKSQFLPAISTAEAEYQLPPGSLAALIDQESHFNPEAMGQEMGKDGKLYQSSAYGLTQITQGTWAGLAPRFLKRYGRDPDKTSPRDQMTMGAMYLRDGLDAEGGDLRKANAYYHGGPGWRTGKTTEADLRHADRVMDRLGRVPTPIPAGNPQVAAEARAQAERQRMQVEFGQINFRADLTVNGAGPGQSPSVVVTGKVGKPVAAGAAGVTGATGSW